MEGSLKAASRCLMFIYFLLPHWVPATWRRRAQTSIRAELPSGKVPTTLVRLRISRFRRSLTLFVRIRGQCSKCQYFGVQRLFRGIGAVIRFSLMQIIHCRELLLSLSKIWAACYEYAAHCVPLFGSHSSAGLGSCISNATILRIVNDDKAIFISRSPIVRN